MIRNVIFDWSGTLVDDLPAVWSATNHVFEKAGVAPLTLPQFRAEFSLPFKGFYDRYVPELPLTELEALFHGHFRTVQHLVVELPHARAFLEFCRQHGLRTFLLSTIHRDHFAEQSTRIGFGDYLDRPYVEVLDKRVKIRELLAENGLVAEETVFIGDMQHDIETAHHGGVHSCAVLTGFNHLDQLRAAEPDVIVEHLGELQGILERNGFNLQPATQSKSGGALPIATVGAVIFDAQERVLMIRTQKWSNLWGIPGGKIKWGEASEDALRRELREETGLEVEDIRFVMVQDCIRSTEFYREAHFILLNYRCRAVGTGPVVLNEEAQEFCWVTLAEALRMNLNQPTRRLLEAL